jgi:ShK domain-like
MMTMTALLAWWWLTLATLSTVAVIAEETCKLDGTCANECQDMSEECQSWATEGLCRDNRVFMLKVCPKACHACGHGNEDQYNYGVEQVVDEARRVEIAQAMDDMKAYFRTKREDPKTTDKFHKVLDNCKNQHESCAFWKVLGECEKVRHVSLNLGICRNNSDA